MHFITDVCNYADDTTLYTWDNELNKLVKRLENEIVHIVDWFNWNFMKLNGDKCHLLIEGRKSEINVQRSTVVENDAEKSFVYQNF